MTAQLIRAADLTQDVPYAYASITSQAALIFTAGACPLDANGEVVGVGDIATQASQTMENLVATLTAAGAGLADVLKTTVFVASADRRDLVDAWDVVRATFGDHDVPSTLLGVAALGYEGQLVEIDAVAERPAIQPGSAVAG
jgi:enamine deaminase RidA (YjgF/YER057c/UK114 family)